MKYIYIVLFICLGLGVSAQDIVTSSKLDKKSTKIFKQAQEMSRKRNYEKSIQLLEKVLKREPLFIDGILMKSGMHYNRGEYDKSLADLNAAVKLAPDYDPMMYYSLATIYREVDDYDAAAINYEQYLHRKPQGKKAARAEKLMEQCRFISEQLKNPVSFNPESMGSLVNTESSEYIPQPAVDGSHMIFTRRVRGQEDFYIAYTEQDSVTRVEPLDALNTPYNEGVHTMSADGKMILYTACDRRLGEGSCDLYYAFNKGGEWEPGAGFASIVNSPGWDAQPSLSADGKMLFFSSSRPGGKGGRDIWVTIKTDTAGWLTPQSLSEKVNTPQDEESPFIHPDGRTLYFRSNGHLGMGSYDIFYSRFDRDKGGWSEPKNLGYPINTKGNEGALSVSLDGKTAYYASDRAYLEAEDRNLDIYKFTLYPEARPLSTTFVRASIVDDVSGEAIAAHYKVNDVNRHVQLTSGVAAEGSFIYALPINRNYAIAIEHDGYLFYSENINLTEVNTALEPYEIEVRLQKVPVEREETTVIPETKPVVLNNVFFVSGSAELLPESYEELDMLVDLLNAYEGRMITITGHTDHIGTPEDNIKLSKERAGSVKNYLISTGISSGRITTVGKGESEPIATNDTPEGRQKNRRVEFTIK